MDIKNKYDNFDSILEFYDNLNRGGEIEFRYENINYSITHSEEGIHFIEAYNEESEKIFSSPEELGELEINGRKIVDIIIEVQIIFRCF